MIWRYQNEIIVLMAVFFLAGGFLYQNSMSNRLEGSLSLNKITEKEIKDIKILQRVWNRKGIKQKIAELKNVIPSGKFKTFDQKKGRLDMVCGGLTGVELNNISTNLASLPISIEKFIITRSGDSYEMRCSCTW